MTGAARVVPAGDASLVVELEERIDPDVNARVVSLAASIRAAAFVGVLEVVPAYRSLAVYFDPTRTDAARLTHAMNAVLAAPAPRARAEKREILVPVCYGGEYGPDLAVVAEFAGLSDDDVIGMHAATAYRVYMLGFLPGFAYMGEVDPRIAAPRRQTPRPRVAAGSVAIAGGQTGIYPFDTPGGWQIIGRTPLRPCDFTRPAPFLFGPGDRVRFQAIGAAAFARLTGDAAGTVR